MNNYFIILASGQSKRFNSYKPKQFNIYKNKALFKPVSYTHLRAHETRGNLV